MCVVLGFLCVFGVCSIISYRYKLHVTVQQIGMIEWMEWKQSTLWPNPKFQAIIHMAFLFALAFRFDFARTAAYGGQCAVFLLFFLFLIVSICCSNKKNRNTWWEMGEIRGICQMDNERQWPTFERGREREPRNDNELICLELKFSWINTFDQSSRYYVFEEREKATTTTTLHEEKLWVSYCVLNRIHNLVLLISFWTVAVFLWLLLLLSGRLVTISWSTFIHWFIHGNNHINLLKWRRKPRALFGHFSLSSSYHEPQCTNTHNRHANLALIGVL